MSKNKAQRGQRRKEKENRRKRRQARKFQAGQPLSELALLEELAESFAETGFIAPEKILINPPGHEKMSEVLTAFLEPYMPMTRRLENVRRLADIATVAWNIALAPEPEEREAQLEEFVASLGQKAGEDARAVIAELIERKLTFFAEHSRLILNVTVTDLGDSLHFSVLSKL